MELKELIRKRIEENVPHYDIAKLNGYEYLFEMIAIEFASERAKSLSQANVIKSVCPDCNSENVTKWIDGELSCYDCKKHWSACLHQTNDYGKCFKCGEELFNKPYDNLQS